MKLGNVLLNETLQTKFQFTLAIIKPHVIQAPHALKEVRNRIKESGFFILKTRRLQLQREEAESFYSEHRDKFFFWRLVSFMCSGSIDVHILARSNAIQHWRQLMGPTKVFRAVYSHPESLRGCYGLSDTRNAAHGSDSEDSAEREIKYFFPQLKLSELFLKSQQTDKKLLYFNEEKFEHQL